MLHLSPPLLSFYIDAVFGKVGGTVRLAASVCVLGLGLVLGWLALALCAHVLCALFGGGF